MPALNTKLVDYTGQIFGRLTVLHDTRVPNPSRKNGRRAWVCQCSCGIVKTVPHSHLKSGHTVSCGCYNREKQVKKIKPPKFIDPLRPRSNRPEYKIWKSMRRRCHNPTDRAFHHYGGRGITVCERWNDFACFYADMGERPSNKHSINRIDNDGDYCPENCEWADDITQMNNTRRNRNITYQGKTQSIAMWCRELHIPSSTIIASRLDLGWSVEDALTIPMEKGKKISNPNKPANKRRGENLSIAKLTNDQVRYIRATYKRGVHTAIMLAKELGVHENTVFNVIHGKYYKTVE